MGAEIVASLTTLCCEAGLSVCACLLHDSITIKFYCCMLVVMYCGLTDTFIKV